MFRVIRIVIWAISTISFAVGLFWLPSDLSDWPQAAEPWKRWLSMVDVTTVLFAILFLFSARLLWVDAKPYFERLLSKYNRPVRGRYPARLVFEFDRQTGHVRRLENKGVARYFFIGKGNDGLTSSLLIIAFERDTGLDRIELVSNDSSPARCSIVDKSERLVILQIDTPVTVSGYTFSAENVPESYKLIKW